MPNFKENYLNKVFGTLAARVIHNPQNRYIVDNIFYHSPTVRMVKVLPSSILYAPHYYLFAQRITNFPQEHDFFGGFDGLFFWRLFFFFLL